jgi:succinate-semialdehyde dehydrogenase/glutarate-semialdehyde dehydrogenase
MVMSLTNPTTGLVEATYTEHTEADVASRLASAQSAHDTVRRTSFAQRAAWMRASADVMESDADRLATTVVREMGKPVAQARAEVQKCIVSMRFYAEQAESFLADEPLAQPETVGASVAYARYQPLGIVLAVMPWNFPLWQVMRFAAPALMAGNTGVLKHASNVPESALYLDTLFTRGGFPEGAFGTLMIPAKMVSSVIDDPRVRAVTLTGSEPAGREVASQAGRQIKKSVLELGGSDAFIVMPSADLRKSATVAVAARMNNNGQSCIAGKRFIIHADIYVEWRELFVAEMAELVVGDPMDPETNVGPLATEKGRQEIVSLVDDARAKGADILLGGVKPEGRGFFYPPTVIEGITSDMRLSREEAFGPIASIYKVSDREEAIAIANQTTFGLSSAVWTSDVTEEEFFAEKLEAGAVFINGMTISYPQLPFGGIKDSGFGRELGAPGIKEFTNMKTIWKA